jgi:opacity protein-like surface antigen
MFRKTLIILASAVLGAAPALASDFSGGYVGFFTGTQSATDVFHSDETGDSLTVEPSGTVYGFMIGYNHQDENFVIGTEFEFGLSSTEETLLIADPSNTFGYDISDEIGKTMRLRARFGYAMGSFMPDGGRVQHHHHDRR